MIFGTIFVLVVMFQWVRDNPEIIIIVNILFSYGIYNCCASILWQLFIYDDVQYNSNYETDNHWMRGTIIVAGTIAYATNAAQLVFMTTQYSRHFGCIGTVINQFVFIYIWVALTVIEGSGCKERDWLSCYKNETAIVNNDGISQSKTKCIYGIMFLFFMEIVFSIYSYWKNKNTIYYFYPDCCREITAMILFHYVAALAYSLLPLVLWCALCAGSGAGSGEGSGGEGSGGEGSGWEGSGGEGDDAEKCIYVDYIYTGRPYHDKQTQKDNIDESCDV